MQAILRAVQRGYIRGAGVTVVISNRPAVRALEIARRANVPTMVIESAQFSGSRQEYDALLVDALERHGITGEGGLVLLAGFDRILSPFFVLHFRNRVMNIHPALLPSFTGLHAQEQALDYGVKIAGCTVHLVSPEVDAGPVIVQKSVRVREDDTPETLAARILREEHKAYPEAVKLFVEGRLKVDGRKVRVASRK